MSDPPTSDSADGGVPHLALRDGRPLWRGLPHAGARPRAPLSGPRLFLVTDRCASYCRYCTRSRVVSGVGEQELETDFEAAFRYLEQHTEIRDVLLSGGDPLLFSDAKLEKILERLRRIPHLEFLRIGSRVPVFLPQRITPELCAMLRKFHPLFLSVHVNHPRELTLEVKEALERLADSGIPLGNQSVLLKGVNDDLPVMKTLVHKLLMCRVRPYYLYQLDLIQGSSHLEVPVGRESASSRDFAATPPATPFPSMSSTLRAAAGRFRSIPTTCSSAPPTAPSSAISRVGPSNIRNLHGGVPDSRLLIRDD